MAWYKPAAGLGAVMLMAACTGQPLTPTAPTYLTGTLTGTQEVPPTASPGNGNVIATFDQRSRVLTWTENYAGLTGPPQSTVPQPLPYPPPPPAPQPR